MKRTISLGLVLLVLVMSVVPVYSVTDLEIDKEIKYQRKCISIIETVKYPGGMDYPYTIFYSKDGYTGYLSFSRIEYLYNGTQVVSYHGTVCLIDQY